MKLHHLKLKLFQHHNFTTTASHLQETADMSADGRPHLDKAKLKKQFDISHFDLNAIIRGIQLTLVGGTQPNECPNCCSRNQALTRSNSPASTAEPRDLYLAALQAGRHCRCCRHCHPHADSLPGSYPRQPRVLLLDPLTDTLSRLDHRHQSPAMVSLLLLFPRPGHLGRQAGQWPHIHRGARPASSALLHESHALCHAHTG